MSMAWNVMCLLPYVFNTFFLFMTFRCWSNHTIYHLSYRYLPRLLYQLNSRLILNQLIQKHLGARTRKIHTNTHTFSWWLLLGWVTANTDHPLIRFDVKTLKYRALTNDYRLVNTNWNCDRLLTKYVDYTFRRTLLLSHLSTSWFLKILRLLFMFIFFIILYLSGYCIFQINISCVYQTSFHFDFLITHPHFFRVCCVYMSKNHLSLMFFLILPTEI